MPSFIYMHGLMGSLLVGEDPHAVEAMIDDEPEGQFITVHSMSQTEVVTPRVQRPDGRVIATKGMHDSFVPLKIRHAAVLAVRAVHPGEVPDPSPDPLD
jgi:hypothetical protein